MILEKITQQKDAHSHVLSKVRFCHVFPDVVKGAPDLHFHVGEYMRGQVSGRQ